jgi:hypothetical protein
MNKTRKDKCKIFLMTISTKHNPALDRLINSAKTHGFNPSVLGMHENKSRGHSKGVIGFGDGQWGFKLQYLLDFCKKKKPNDIVLYTDAWDVVIVNDCSTAIKVYKSFKKDIVIGAEKLCMPHPWNFYKFNWFSDTFPFLNAGVIMGKANTIIKLIEKYWDKSENIDDQLLWQKIYLENKDKIVLDTSAKLILNTPITYSKYYSYKDNIFTYDNIIQDPNLFAFNPFAIGPS